MSSLAKALPTPVKFPIGKGQHLTFCRIGLDIWSEFCEMILQRRTGRISDLSLGDTAKAGLYKDLVGKGVDMEDMLEEASTTEGMRWMLCRCCTSNVPDDELGTLIRLRDMPLLFGQLADMEQATEDEALEAGNEPAPEGKTGA
tara:strand:- start:831 stop:1262 length:432 start_codon:yes stop_codon:yes gene_type:complete